ncbi:MAG TPA: 50S ribosomal protein L6 [Candidatus Paceibacterota bacterium]
MSRIGKKPIVLPSGVSVSVVDGDVVVHGKGGTLTRVLHPSISVTSDEKQVVVAPKMKTRLARALWGTYTSHIRNMVSGVVSPFVKKLQIEGIGYRAELSGKQIKLLVGFSHPVLITVPNGLAVSVEKNIITISGADKELVGAFAASVRSVRKPEPYKGKGIRYVGEVIREKQGKKAVATT